MTPRRIIAVSPDARLRDELAAVLEVGGGVVESHASLASLASATDVVLAVIHLGADAEAVVRSIRSRLPRGCHVIAVLPRSDLATIVGLLQGTEQLSAVIAMEHFDPPQLAAIARRLVTGDIYGLARVMAGGTQLETHVVDTYDAKAACAARVIAAAERAGVARSRLPSIEQCLDEMLMNALYDAVVDERGERILADVPARARASLAIERPVIVEYGGDAQRFGIAVRDAYGSLERATVLRVLHKCLHSAQQVDGRAGGAGVGLYLLASTASSVLFSIVPGLATEALCTFPIETPARPLEQLGFFIASEDVTGTVADAFARVARPRARAIRRARHLRLALGALAITVVATLAVVAVAWSRGGETEAAATRVATVSLDSRPSEAAVEIDGTRIGETPLAVTSLAPGSNVVVVFRRTGYQDASVRLQVPPAGEATELVHPLQRSDAFVPIRFVSTPPGARVIDLAASSAADGGGRTYTPAEVFVEADQLQRFMLTMPGHLPLVIEPFTPARGTATLERGGDLVKGATLQIEGAAGGTVTISGAPHCVGLRVPAECTLAPGAYTVDYVGPDARRATRAVEVTERDQRVTFGAN